jgi:RND family efflux transporter MFP subunit
VAEARLALVKAGPMPEEVAIAQAQVQQAEAALARVQIQLDKLTLTAPRDGVVTERPANPGELATPGATLLQLGDLDQVTLTVFIPETQIGPVDEDQIAYVTVDAYPGEVFEGRVTFIATEAEFTPKNVQTEEERVNLVFAVKISLVNPDHRLKPGMPADAEIITGP